MKNKIACNIIVNYLGQGWSALMAVAFLPLYVACLGFEAYGLIGFFSVMQSMLAVFDFGISATLTREAARCRNDFLEDQRLRDLVWTTQIIGAVINTILAIALCFLSRYLAKNWVNANQISLDSIIYSIDIMGLVIAIRLQEGIYRGVLLGLARQIEINVVGALIATFRYAGAVGVLFYGSAGIVEFFLWQGFISILSLIVMATIAYHYLPAPVRQSRFSLETIATIWHYSANVAIINGASLAMGNLDKLIFSNLLPLAEFGRYTMASTAAGILYLIVVPIAQGFYPYMVKANDVNDKKTLIRLHHISSQLVTVAVGSLAIIIIFFSGPLIYVWSGNIELTNLTSPVFIIVAAAALANCLGYIGQNLKLISGSPGTLTPIAIGVVLMTLLLLPIVTKKYGLIAGAYGWFAITVIQAGILLKLAHHGSLQGEGIRWLTRDVALPILGASVIAWLISCFVPEPQVLGRLIMAIFLLAFSCFTFALIVLLSPDLGKLIKAFIINKAVSEI